MSESIKEFNKQIASFIIVSAALSLPAISTDADAVQNAEKIEKCERQVMLFYGAPQRPVIPVKKEEISKEKPVLVFYGAPEIPKKESTEIKDPVVVAPVMSLYAAPQNPVLIIESSPIQKQSDFSEQKMSEDTSADSKEKIRFWDRLKRIFK